MNGTVIARSQERYVVAEARFRLPMLVLSVLLLPLLLVPVVDSSLSPGIRRDLDLADWCVYGAFVVEYVTLLVLAVDRRHYVRTHVLELLLVVVPVLRPLRVARAARAARALRFGRATLLLGFTARRGRRSRAFRGVTYVASVAFSLVFVCAAAELTLERHARGATIHTIADALWWAASTVTTVGYGDRYPVTAGGRAVAVVLMLAGIAVVGVLTAAVAAWFVREDGSEASQELVELGAEQVAVEISEASDLELLRREVAMLRETVLALGRSVGLDAAGVTVPSMAAPPDVPGMSESGAMNLDHSRA